MITLLILAVTTLALLAARIIWRGGWRWPLMLMPRLIAVGLTLAALLALTVLVWSWPWWARLLVLLPLAGLAAHAAAQRVRSAAVVTRWGNRARRTHGVATTWQITRLASGWAARRKTRVVRPSLGAQPWAARARARTSEVAIPIARVGLQRIWASIEDVILTFGGPRTGKSGWLAGSIVDAPGACVVTSTRTDLHDLTAPLRAERGPVYVFNADGLGGLASSISFDPLTGCESPTAAAARAEDMLRASSVANGGDREFWEAQARRVLGALMHAAALDGRTMRDVLAWVAAPDEHAAAIAKILRRSPEPSLGEDAAQFLTTNDRTRSSITSSVMPALQWLSSPTAVAATQDHGGRAPALDVAQLLAERGTVYLLGSEESQTAPLVCALTGHIAREARRIAALQPGGRLDPPLALRLDEAALIAPVPLDRWTADMGGRGVSIVAAFQSRAQVQQRWGDDGAAIVLNNASTVMLFGGTKDDRDLQRWQALAGDRDEEVVTRDGRGRVTSRTVRKVPVLTAAQLSNLPRGHVAVFTRGLPPAIGRPQMAWKRRDVKAAQHAAQSVTQPTQSAQAQPEAVGAHV